MSFVTRLTGEKESVSQILLPYPAQARTLSALTEHLMRMVAAGLFPALLADVDSAPVADRLKPVLHYVRKLTLTPTRMVQADADAVFSAGWEERDFHLAILICGLFNLYNRLLEGYGCKNTETYRRTAGAELAEIGYLHVAEIAAGAGK